MEGEPLCESLPQQTLSDSSSVNEFDELKQKLSQLCSEASDDAAPCRDRTPRTCKDRHVEQDVGAQPECATADDDENDDEMEEIPATFRRPKSKSLPGEMIEIHTNILLQQRMERMDDLAPHSAIHPRRKVSFPAEGYLPMRLRKNSIPEEVEPTLEQISRFQSISRGVLPATVDDDDESEERLADDSDEHSLGDVKYPSSRDDTETTADQPTECQQQQQPKQKKLLLRKNTPANFPKISKIDFHGPKAGGSLASEDVSEKTSEAGAAGGQNRRRRLEL
ncbi:PREDICTED: uncharacterized protein LOC106805644 [Priapulus caudatus]|uniref:Uncharacterized protein LOC106805644 n=1 Tax=Priapulus caudatus TaxID=37621 RepID=A0ABM1DS97_PRICU|nr:PREDICTED: uncharacterized protein LOC106805644 [Priapulus caudatus]